MLVVGGQSAVKGVVAASPNEEARIAREAAAASRQERIRQVRRQLSAAARDQQRKQRELAQQRRDMARSRVHDAMLEEQSASISALHESTAAGPADFGSAHLAAPQIVADTLEAARERRMEMLEEQRREQVRFQLALQEEQLLKAMGPEAQAREINARRIRARAEEAEAARAEAAAWADKRAAALAAQQSDPNQTSWGRCCSRRQCRSVTRILSVPRLQGLTGAVVARHRDQTTPRHISMPYKSCAMCPVLGMARSRCSGGGLRQ